jgi:hypothetical protein
MSPFFETDTSVGLLNPSFISKSKSALISLMAKAGTVDSSNKILTIGKSNRKRGLPGGELGLILTTFSAERQTFFKIMGTI